MYIISNHASKRMAQRGITEQMISYVTSYGQCFHTAGAIIYHLRKNDIPVWDRANDVWMKLAGTAVIFSKDKRTIITAWRNVKDGLKKVKRKPKYSMRLQMED